jgi:integrase
MAKSKRTKPEKPRPDFPLFPHASGRWAKKVRGKFAYFGTIADDPQGKAALELWIQRKDDLLAGRTPRTKREGLTIRELANHFLRAKKALVDGNEITPRTFTELYATCERLGKAFGWDRLVDDIAADDFEHLRRAIAKTWGPVRLGNEIQRVRSVFKYGFEAGLIQQPVRYGPTFKKPSRKVLRLSRAKKGPKMLEATELRQLLDKATVPMRAMILLGLNCGFGNSDVATLHCGALDLKRSWVDFPRGKTGIPRRCPLWPNTVAAVRQALAKRPKPTDRAHGDLVFVTKYGRPWRQSERKPVEDDSDTGKLPKPELKQDDAVSKEFAKLLRDLKLHRPGLGFYTLRHVFATVGSEAKDQIAVNALMGHVDETMAAVYRERIDDDRLRVVTEHVRHWLFGDKQAK